MSDERKDVAFDHVFAEILEEVDHQEERWGHDADDNSNAPWHWVAYITQYASKWMAGEFMPLKRTSTDAFRACMIQVAALAVSAVRSVDRQRAHSSKTFYEESE